VKGLADFQESNESTGEIESFICRGYLYRSNKDAQRKVYETAALNVTRYSLFTKKQLEGEKLPPTKNAFKYHLSRAHFQLSIWSSACNSRVNYLDSLHYGWQLEDDKLIAPLEVVELVACKCRGK